MGQGPRCPPRSGASASVCWPAGRRDPGGVPRGCGRCGTRRGSCRDRKSTRLNSSHTVISYAVFCLKKKKRILLLHFLSLLLGIVLVLLLLLLVWLTPPLLYRNSLLKTNWRFSKCFSIYK